MIKLKEVLGKFPIFSSLKEKAIEELSNIALLKQFKKGEIIYKENDPPDNFYLVLSGRIKTYTQASISQQRILEYLYRGTCFGIISLLTEEPHSVTAEAANDSLVVEIDKDKFNKFLKKYPPLALELSKILSRRVKKRADIGKNVFESSIISVYSFYPGVGKSTYSLTLAKALNIEAHKKVVVVEVKKKDGSFYFPKDINVLDIRKFSEEILNKFVDKSLGFDYLKLKYWNDSLGVKKIPSFLSFLTQFYNFIILDLPPFLDPPILSFLTQSDFIHFIASKSSTLSKDLKILKDNCKLKKEQVKIILGENSGYLKDGVSKSQIFATLPDIGGKSYLELIKDYPNSVYTKAIRRIARQISSVRIGLALGSGAAYGLAHIGVLKVLEENNISIDIVSGSSMGSIIAGLWGLGKSWRQIRELALKFKDFPIFSFLDIGFSGKSFLKGQHLKRILRDIFGNKTFYELKRPIMIVCFDFKRRQPYIVSKENLSLYKAILASCSIPGIFAPVRNKDDLLLDGGVLNPLPVSCLIKDGVRKIISVNVSPSKKEIERIYKEESRLKKLNIFDFIFGSIEAMQQEFIQEALSLSDVIIHPEFEEVLWTDFGKVDYFIAKGEEEALQQLEKIRQLQEM